MKKFLKKRVIWIVALAVALALCLSVAAYVRGHSGSFVSEGADVVLSPLERGIASIANRLEDLYAYMYEFDRLEEENAQLRGQLAELEQALRDADAANEENARLRELLNLQQRHQDFQFESARVISWGSSNWSSHFTIGKGRASGLELYDCVVTEDGSFVGQIVELSKDSAVVQTLIDPDTSIGATVARSGAAGLAQGEFSQMTHGCLMLSYLPEGTEILTGDDILTAGSEVFPSGLLLGRVITMESDPGGISEYAVVEPAADLARLTQVFVIKEFEISD